MCVSPLRISLAMEGFPESLHASSSAKYAPSSHQESVEDYTTEGLVSPLPPRVEQPRCEQTPATVQYAAVLGPPIYSAEAHQQDTRIEVNWDEVQLSDAVQVDGMTRAGLAFASARAWAVSGANQRPEEQPPMPPG